MQESWDKQQRASTDNVENSKMASRVPSFFTSNSLVNLSGLGVSDQPTADSLHDYTKVQPNIPPKATVVQEVSLNSGWGGLGLRGNRSGSGGNLQRTNSDASGLFIDEEEHSLRQQQPGEETIMESKLGERSQSEGAFDNAHGYVKTTSMARFYYRKTNGQDDESMQKTSSGSHLGRNTVGIGGRKSMSHADLESSTKDFVAVDDK